MTPIDDAELVAVVAAALRIEPARLTLDTRREDVPEWDSLGHVMAMLAVEGRFGAQLSLAALESVRTLREVKAALGAPG